MIRNLKIELDDEVFCQLNVLCKGDKKAMQDYIAQILKEKLNQNNGKKSHEDNECLENFLKKAQSGSRNYGVKGQGW